MDDLERRFKELQAEFDPSRHLRQIADNLRKRCVTSREAFADMAEVAEVMTG